jgi:hypothetical protein
MDRPTTTYRADRVRAASRLLRPFSAFPVNHSRAKDSGLTVESWVGAAAFRQKAATPNREDRMAETFAGRSQSCTTGTTIEFRLHAATKLDC